MKLQEFFTSLADRLHSSASVKRVYGRPIEAEGKTIVPVAKVCYGFGGGSGTCSADDDDETEEGTGGGGGVMAKPAGVVEITRDDTRFIPANNTVRTLALVAGGVLLGLCLGRRRRRKLEKTLAKQTKEAMKAARRPR